MTMQQQEFRFDAAPMRTDRAAGWRYVREAGDVFTGADGVWYLTSAQSVRFAQQHPEIFSSARAFDSLGSPVPLIPIAIDPPDHVRYRKVLDPLFAPRVVNVLEDNLRAQARDLVAAFAERGECDAIDDLARLYPTQVFLTLFGMPLEDRDQFIYWAETIIENSNRDPNAELAPEVVECAGALIGYLQRYVDDKRANPGDDVLSRVMAIEGDGAWSNDEVLGMCFLLILAGLDTVTAMIGFILYHLARDADLRRRVVADPDLVQPVIEEILRLEQPAPIQPRITTRDVEVCGVTIPSGATVAMCVGAANRDANLFPHPDEVDPSQADTGHVAFGGGIHRCLGSHLARREMRIVIEEFHRLIPEYSVAGGAEPEIVFPSGTFHLRALPLVFPVATA
jgi:cytochrome P450